MRSLSSPAFIAAFSMHFPKLYTRMNPMRIARFGVFVFAVMTALVGYSQTNPTAQSLPFSLTSQATTTLPAGVAAHRFGTTAGAIPTSRTTAVANGDLINVTVSNSGGWMAENANGISLLASSGQSTGALVVAINTTGLSNIQVSWIAGTILQQASYDCSIALQYRVGTSGTWTDVGTTTTYTSQGKTAGDLSSTLTETLPVGAENQSVVQVRWIYWVSNGTSGSRDRINIDQISITGSAGITSAQDGPWTTTSTWVGGVVPTAADNVVIAHNVTAGATTRNSGTTTTINTGASLAVSGTYTNNGTTTVNGTFQLNTGGWATGSNFTFGAAGTLNFNASSSYTVNNTDVFWPTTSGPFNVNVLQGGLTMNSASRTVAGTFATAAGVTLTSSTLTLTGTCQLNAGGFFNQSPTYGSASTLVYNTGGTYGTSNEWTGGATTAVAAGAGVPNNVTIQNNTNVSLGGGRGCSGNMTINSGSVLTLNASSGDFYIAGNLLQNGGSGGLINNSRAVFFVGSSATQTISATGGTVFFDYFIINKPSGTVQISSAVPTNVTINTTAGDVFQIVNAGTLDLNGRTLTFNNNGGNLLSSGGARTITSSVAGGTVAIAGSKTCTFSSGSLTFNTNVTVLLTNGINFGASSTLLGTLQINGGGFVSTNSCTYGAASLLVYNTGGGYGSGTEWTGGAANTVAAGLGIPANVTIQTSGTNVTLAGGRGIPGNLIVSTGATFTLNGTSGDFYTTGNMTFTGTGAFNGNNRAVFFCKNGTQVLTSAAAITIPYIVYSPASGATIVQLGTGTSLTASAPNTGNAIAFSSASDRMDLNGQSLTIGTASVANAISGAGSFTGTTASNMTLLGTGNVGTLNFTSGSQNLNNFTINRTSSGAATLGTALTINGTATFTNGTLSIGSNNLTFAAAATTSGASSSSFIIADGTGEVRKTMTATGSFTYPVGDNSAPDGLQYSPATLNFTAGTFSSAYAGIRVVDAIQPNNEATVDYISRYWVISASGITSPTYSFTGTYTAADIAGTEGNSIAGRWNGTSWITGSAISANTISMTGQTTLTATNHVTAGAPLVRAEMNVKQGVTTYLTGSTYNFGSAAGGSNVDVVFTIENLGLENLNLSAATVTGAEYTLFANYTSPVAAAGTTTFTIRFTPSGSGTFTGNISIPNNDPDDSENPYVINFTGVGTGSASSNVVFNSGASASTNSNIAYASYQSASITAIGDAVGVMGFTVQDGGGTADADALPTILTGISFTVTNVANIRSAALFNGTTLVATATVNGTSPIVFTGMSGANVTAADNGSLNLALHITFQSTVTDNQKMVFTVSSVTAATGGTSSLFAAANGGGAVSENTAGDINRIEVTADRLAFVQQPTTTSVNVNISPAVTVEGEDALGNRDLDFAATVSITSTGTLTGTPVTASAASGLATFSTLQHSVPVTGIQLTAASSGLTSATSNTFDVSAFVNGEYRTTSAGTWTSGGGTATWERVVSGVWTANAAPAFSVSNMIYIRHAISITGSASPANVTIQNGGTLTNSSACTYGTTSLLIENGGKIVANASLTVGGGTFPGTGTFEVLDGGEVELNYVVGPASAIWNGIETFHPNSTFRLRDSATGTTAFFDGARINSNTYSGYTAYFGNLNLDYLTSIGAARTVIAAGTSANICHGDFILTSSPGATLTLCGTGTLNIGVGGDFLVDAAFPANTIQFKTSGTMDFTIEGSYLQEAATVNLTSASGASTSFTLNIKGDMYVITGGIFDLSSTVSSNTVTATVNLYGDLFVDNTSSLQRNNNNNALGFFNFVGTGDGSTAALTQSIDNASTATLENRNIQFVVKNGAYVKLENRNLELGNNSRMTAESGGTIDCSTFSVIEVPATATSTVFDVQSGATAVTANAVGFQSSGATGSAQLDTRTFSSEAHYVYNGTVAQTISGMTTSPTANTMASVTTNNSAGVTLGQDFTVTSTKLRNGIFNMANFNLTSTNTTGSNTFSASNMIVTNGTGAFALVVPTGTGSYTYPMGDNTGTAEYSPITLNFTSNNTQRNIGMKVTDANHPQINNPTTAAVALSRYWTMSTATTTGTYDYTADLTYLAADVFGTEANLWAAGYNGSWNSYQGSLSSPVLTTGSLNQTNAPINGMDLTGRRITDGAAPVITYTAITNQCDIADQTFSVTITDELGLPNSPSLGASTLRPRIYFRKNSGSWFNAAGTYVSGTPTNSTWSFTISNTTMGGVTNGDVIQYYVIAQDVSVPVNVGSNPATGLVASDVSTVTTHPTTPNSFAFNARPTGAISGTATICAGSSTNLTLTVTGSGTISGTLSSGDTFSGTAPTITVSVSPSGTTVYTIATLSDANCSAISGGLTGSATVTVNPLLTPSVSIAASPSNTICTGDNVTFTATPTNGGSTPSYQWYIGASPVGTNSNTYSSSSLSNGNVISVVMTSNAVCPSPTTATSNTVTMTVNAITAASVSIAANVASPICAGTSVTFTATPTGGGSTPSYQWYIGASPVGTNSATFTTTSLTNGNVVSVQMTSSAVCPNPTTATSNTLTYTVTAAPTWYQDADNDGYTSGTTLTQCAQPTGYKLITNLVGGVASPTDCNDSNEDVNPGADEWCNGVDDNCAGGIDEGLGTIAYYLDADGDGYGAGTAVVACSQPANHVLNNLDCNDALAGVNPAANETCDGINNDCDSFIDEGCGPMNDAKSTALPLQINNYSVSYCAITNGTLAGAQTSPEALTSAVTGEDVWYYFTTPATGGGLSIQCASTANNILLELHAANGTLVDSENIQSIVGNETMNIGSLPASTDYYLCVRNYNSAQGAGGPFTLCLKQLSATTCFADPYELSLCSQFKVNFTGGAQFVYHFGPSITFSGVYSAPPALPATTRIILNTVPGLNHNMTFPAVWVDAVYALTDGAGNLELITVPGTDSCALTILPHTDLDLRAIDQNIIPTQQTTKPMGSFIGCTPYICGVTSYDWSFRKVDLTGAPTALDSVVINSGVASAFIRLNATNIPGIQPGDRFRVKIRPRLLMAGNPTPVPGDWGTDFQFVRVTPPAGMTVDSPDLTYDIQLFEKEMAGESFADIYPNPNSGEAFMLNVVNIASGTTGIRIYDSTGKLIHKEQFNTEAGIFAAPITPEFRLNPGIHMVEITLNNGEVKTNKLVVQ